MREHSRRALQRTGGKSVAPEELHHHHESLSPAQHTGRSPEVVTYHTTLTPSQLPHFREGPSREPEGSQLLCLTQILPRTSSALHLLESPISADPEGQVREKPELASSTNCPRLSLCTSRFANSVQGRGCPVGHANQEASGEQSQAPESLGLPYD